MHNRKQRFILRILWVILGIIIVSAIVDIYLILWWNNKILWNITLTIFFTGIICIIGIQCIIRHKGINTPKWNYPYRNILRIVHYIPEFEHLIVFNMKGCSSFFIGVDDKKREGFFYKNGVCDVEKIERWAYCDREYKDVVLSIHPHLNEPV